MPLSYNSRLLPMKRKGLCGDPETFDEPSQLADKLNALASLIHESKYIVAFTGAGISTSCGIADFRGPSGVWTKELQQHKKRSVSHVSKEEDSSHCFDVALPSTTHNALMSMIRENKLQHIVSQNVDGLHLRSGVSSKDLTELHGNIFIEECVDCGTKYFRSADVGGMGLKPNIPGIFAVELHHGCISLSNNSFPDNRCDNLECNGVLIDNAVDWDTELSDIEFDKGDFHLKKADLVLCLGTSLRIRPAGNMPLQVLKKSKYRVSGTKTPGKIVIVNLQQTHLDCRAALKINHYCDVVMAQLCALIGVNIVPAEVVKTGEIPRTLPTLSHHTRNAINNNENKSEKSKSSRNREDKTDANSSSGNISLSCSTKHNIGSGSSKGCNGSGSSGSNGSINTTTNNKPQKEQLKTTNISSSGKTVKHIMPVTAQEKMNKVAATPVLVVNNNRKRKSVPNNNPTMGSQVLVDLTWDDDDDESYW